MLHQVYSVVMSKIHHFLGLALDYCSSVSFPLTWPTLLKCLFSKALLLPHMYKQLGNTEKHLMFWKI